MIDPKSFTAALREAGFDFFTGVPDSLLKELCACMNDTLGEEHHVIAANEGAAVALATGYHLGTGNAAVVYLQNSGTGNAVNPLLSLADPQVYAIPMLLVVGWRGEPGVKDEPQHIKQGAVQEDLMRVLGYPYEILSENEESAREQLGRLSARMSEGGTPVALLVRKGTFSEYGGAGAGQPAAGAAGGGGASMAGEASSGGGASSAGDVSGVGAGGEAAAPVAGFYPMSREEALTRILPHLEADARIVSTTGKTSREIYELREARGEGHAKDFLTVGSMGHAISIALGLARTRRAPVYCIDGDGAAIMHLGSLGVAAQRGGPNLRHIIINNGAHESVGGQPTIGFALSFERLARELGYRAAWTATNAGELDDRLDALRAHDGPALLEVRVRAGARADLGRPKSSPAENKRAFMEGL